VGTLREDVDASAEWIAEALTSSGYRADFEWSTDDDAPDGEIHAAVVLADGTSVWPMRRVMQRYSNGPEDGIYEYGLVVTQ
jgi:hypothetical protein